MIHVLAEWAHRMDPLERALRALAGRPSGPPIWLTDRWHPQLCATCGLLCIGQQTRWRPCEHKILNSSGLEFLNAGAFVELGCRALSEPT